MTYLFRVWLFLRCKSSVTEFLFVHFQPATLSHPVHSSFNWICNFAVPLALVLLHTLSVSAEKMILLSPMGKLISQRCLNVDCQHRKRIFNKDWIKQLMDKPKRIQIQNIYTYICIYILKNMLPFYLLKYCPCFDKLSMRLWTLHVYREVTHLACERRDVDIVQ